MAADANSKCSSCPISAMARLSWCAVREAWNKLTDEKLYWSAYALLGGCIAVNQVFAPPVLLQMVLHTFPIIYIGSHLSLLQKGIDPETGKKQIKTETLGYGDAILFPVLGSAALFSLYVAYKSLPARWVNLLLTTYLALIGCAAMTRTVIEILHNFPLVSSWETSIFSMDVKLPTTVGGRSIGPIQWALTGRKVMASLTGAAIGVFWFWTNNWTAHNLLAIAFCLQGIKMISVGSFQISCILLCGLFFYDIFWVFGTDVMVTVAKSFEAPAKLIFPICHHPWKQSILGLGDIVIPGIFIAMNLRFDHYLDEQLNGGKNIDKKLNIHEQFPKFYFWCNIVAYELGLVTTGVVMLVFNRAQPALLYLVPACLVGFFVPAWWNGDLLAVLQYTEAGEEQSSTTSTSENRGAETTSTAEDDDLKTTATVVASGLFQSAANLFRRQ